MTDWYDRTGRPISMEEAGSLLSTPGYKHVALAEITSATDPSVKYRVSTVWLGLDHNWGDGDPLIFETMVFPDTPRPRGHHSSIFDPDPAWVDMLCRRYTNELDAELGHEEVIILVAATVADEVITRM